MQQHSLYLKEHLDAGRVLIYGPVFAPGGAFGMAVMEAGNEAEVNEFFERDPSVLGRLNRFEFYPMRVGVARAPLETDSAARENTRI